MTNRFSRARGHTRTLKDWKALPSIVILLATLILYGSGLSQETLVQEFRGSGASNTRPFTVEPGWEIQWDANGDIFQLFLNDMDGNPIGVPANQMGPGQGASYQAQGGTYYLQVNALGEWIVQIVQLERDAGSSGNGAQADASGAVEFTGNGAVNTRPFSMDGPWEIQWEADGDIFQVFLHTADGEIVDVAANQMGSGSGTSFQPRGGEYYLQVNAIGDWTVRVLPLGPQ